MIQTPAKTEVYYPESDGKPMAETKSHARVMIYLASSLEAHFLNRPDVYVGINQFLYYVEGKPSKKIAPDVFVVLGVPKEPPRPTWKVWVEGKAPSVVFEITSRATAEVDLGKKLNLYERLGVEEYFLVDVTLDYLPDPLALHRLVKGHYDGIPPQREALDVWRLPSEVLKLDVVVQQVGHQCWARLYDPAAQRWLPSPEEAQIEAAEARVRAEQAEARAKDLEEQLRALQAEMERLQERTE